MDAGHANVDDVTLMETVYIVGAAESPLGEVSDQSELSMVAIAAREALAEAGLAIRDVDGLFVNYMGDAGSVQVADYLGIQPRYSNSTDLGGAAFEAHVGHAWAALAGGRCEVALVAYASRQRSRRSRRLTMGWEGDHWPLSQIKISNRPPLPDQGIVWACGGPPHARVRSSPEQLAEVAVAARQVGWTQP